MSSAEYSSLHIVHVCAAMLLLGTVFYAVAGPPEARKKILMWSGIASLLVLVTAVRMWQTLYHFSGGWAVVKLVCWLGLSALTGLAYRRRDNPSLWVGLGVLLAFVAVVMVYAKPF